MTASKTMIEELKSRMSGLWADCLSELAPDLEEAVDALGKHVPCPFHGGEDGFRLFKDAEETGGGVCNTCGKFADGFALLMEANGWDFPESVREVRTWLTRQENDDMDEEFELPPVDQGAEKQLRAIERGAVVDTGIISAYLASRGLSGKVPESLLLHPDLGYFEGKEKVGSFPAILAPITHPSGYVVAYMRTFLAADGKRKAPVDSAKRITKSLWKGATTGGAIQVYPAEETLVVTEGVETTIAIHEATSLAVWAAGSAGGMERIMLPSLVERVIIAADNDKSGVGFKAAQVLAERLLRENSDRVVEIALPDKDDSDWLDVLVDEGADAVRRGFADTFVVSLETGDVPEEQCCVGDNVAALYHHPLIRPLPPPEPFPIGALGVALAAACRDLVQVTQAPESLCGQSILAAVSLGVQAYSDVNIDGRVRPCSNYFLTIAESGERKTAVDSEVLAPVRKYENELRVEFEAARDEFCLLAEEYEIRKREAMKSPPEERAEALKALGAPPIEPRTPIILSEDPTIEGLGKSLVGGRPTMGLFSDEGGRFMGGYGMSKENQLRTIAGLSKLYDGTTFNTVRSSSPVLAVAGKRLAVHLMVQPGIARKFLGDKIYADQGIVNRMLVSQPESRIGQRRYVRGSRDNTPSLDGFRHRIGEILREPLPLRGESNELEPRQLVLSNAALDAYIGFHDEIEHELRPDGQFSTVRGFASKAAEHACRLAAVLTLYEDLNSPEIPLENMTGGIELARYYLSEAVRQIGTGLVDEDLELAEKLLNWMQQRGSRHTIVDIYQKGPTAIREAETARKIVGILESHGWVQKVKDEAGKGKKSKREIYELI